MQRNRLLFIQNPANFEVINMAIFVVALKQMLILFLLIFLGYLLQKKDLIDGNYAQNTLRIVVNICLPAVIIKSLQIPRTDDLLMDGLLFFLATLIVHFVALLGGIFTSNLLKIQGPLKGAWISACWGTNIGIIGMPIALALFGQAASFYVSIGITTVLVFMFTGGVYAVAKYSNSEGVTVKLHKVIINPCSIAFIIGGILFWFSIPLPPIIMGTLDMLSSFLVPAAMIATGSLMIKIPLVELFNDWKLYMAMGIKLLLMPIATFLIFQGRFSDPLFFSVLVVFAAMPFPGPSLAAVGQYGGDLLWITKFCIVSTLFSVITIPLIVMLL